MLARMLAAGANRLKENHELLSTLDAATGDGDHGTTIKKVAEAMLEAIATAPAESCKELLNAVGWSVLSVDGGSASPLLGSLLLGMADGAGAEIADPAGLAAVFESGLARFRAQTPAQIGDKTMLDALLPAVEAMRGSPGIMEAMKNAADAAAQGAESTKPLQARFGRARNLGARSIGPVDPGATSIALLFAGCRDGLL